MKPPTPKQRKAAKAIVKNLLSDQPEPECKVLANVGYSKGITETPSIVINSEGFKNALSETGLREALVEQGINPTKIAEKINVLLDATTGENEKPDVNAIDKGLKHATAIYGIVDDKPKNTGGNTYNFIFSDETKAEVKKIEDVIKAKLIQQNVKED